MEGESRDAFRAYSLLPSLSDYLQLECEPLTEVTSTDELVQLMKEEPEKIFGRMKQMLDQVPPVSSEKRFTLFLETCRWLILGGKPDTRVKHLEQEVKQQ